MEAADAVVAEPTPVAVMAAAEPVPEAAQDSAARGLRDRVSAEVAGASAVAVRRCHDNLRGPVATIAPLPAAATLSVSDCDCADAASVMSASERQ